MFIITFLVHLHPKSTYTFSNYPSANLCIYSLWGFVTIVENIMEYNLATKTMSIEDSFYLTLNEFGKTVRTIWKTLQTENDFYDMTMACGDTLIQTHKVIISAMSPVLRNILKQNSNQHPLIYLKGIKFEELNNLISFIYWIYWRYNHKNQYFWQYMHLGWDVLKC